MFTVIVTVTVAAPVVLHLTAGARAERLLARIQGWMSRNNAAIVSVLCLVIGAKLVGDGVSGLTG